MIDSLIGHRVICIDGPYKGLVGCTTGIVKNHLFDDTVLFMVEVAFPGKVRSVKEEHLRLFSIPVERSLLNRSNNEKHSGRAIQ